MRRAQWAPPAHAHVNWSHPLAQGLRDFVYGPGVNIGRPNCQPTFTGSVTRVDTAWGEGLYIPGTGSINIPAAGLVYHHDGTTRRPFTARTVGTMISQTGTQAALWERVNDATSDRDFGVYFNNGDHDASVLGPLGTGGNHNTNAHQALPLFDFVAVFNGVNVLRFFLNGVYIGVEFTVGGTWSAAATPATWKVGNGGTVSATNGLEMNHLLTQGWTRGLSDSEVAALHADPFAMVASR